MTASQQIALGLTEQELRDALTEELELAFRTEGDTRTIHGFAHSIARVLELDHLRIAEQLASAGVDISAVERAPS
ncbi:MAG TPA: hypothetical protein VI540_04305 [Gaiellaceae bacterium]|nr:hypothetical protein [Gaiellaceae bacterium]HLE99098.1 hypothetical protein [Gaiellaceae bacterium]